MATDTTDQVEDVVLDDNGIADVGPSPSHPASLDQAFRTLIEPIENLVAKIADRLDGERQLPAGRNLDEVFERLEALQQREAAISSNMVKVVRRVKQLLDHLESHETEQMNPLAPAAGESVATSPSPTTDASDRWETALFGDELSANDAVVADRRELLDGTLAGQEDAMGLVGRILLVRSVSANELPPLLKEIGEAYYRWRPKTADVQDPFEQAFVAWLVKRIEQTGLRNSIALVHPGDRYDSSRHHSLQKGVEVAEVHGWVVLRENGKAIGRANVSLK